MKEVILKSSDRLLQIINKILTSESSEIKIVIPEDSILFKNILNLKILQRVIDSSKIIAKFETNSSLGKSMLSQIRENDQDEADFSKYQESLKEEKEKILEDVESTPKFKFPVIKFPSLSLPNLKMLPVILGAVLIVLGASYYFLIYNYRVDVEILVSAERFAKSFEIKVSSFKNTSVEDKILRGDSVVTVYQAAKEIPTTGKVDGGKKAEGEVKILNKTDKEIKLKKETKLTYKESGKTYNFLILEDVVVPERSLISTAPETFVSGEKTVSAEATSFGSSYNLAAGKNLTIEGYATSELSAVVSSSFEGGVKTTLNAVSEQDLKEVSSLSFDEFKSKFVFVTSPSKIILKNSESFSLANQKFSAQLTEPSDKLQVTQDIYVSYLEYDYNQALSFVKSSIKSLIPEGYELYGKDFQIELNSLGSPSGVSYDSKEANVQLTIKSYKIPLLDEEKIKKEIAGKKISEVSTYLEDLNVNYNIESSSGLLNLLGLPKDINKINVTVSREE